MQDVISAVVKTTLVVVLIVPGATPGPATDLYLTLAEQSSGATAVTVAPAAEVSYQVLGELGDNLNEGLALVVFDLEYDGGALSPASVPSTPPMASFVPPEGFSHNPDGYGGSVQGGRLLQVGGAQNVANHGSWSCTVDDDCPGASTCAGSLCTVLPGLPTGALVTGVAAPGAPVVIATGTLTAPATAGTYTLSATNLQALVLRQNASGDPFWATEAVTGSTVSGLTINVQALQQAAIPILSGWGRLIMVLSLLAAGLWLVHRRLG
jgi:hypothetical protein